jgi:predicted nucleic acid-binding Zn ribbon protein
MPDYETDDRSSPPRYLIDSHLELRRRCICCGRPLPKDSPLYRQHCSSSCRLGKSRPLRARKTSRKSSQDGVLTSGMSGALNELIVSADLLARHIHVFRALSPSCPCDLIVLHDGKLLRVEVTAGAYNLTGGFTYIKHNSDNYDVIAVVFKDRSICYLPDIFPPPLDSFPDSWGPSRGECR